MDAVDVVSVRSVRIHLNMSGPFVAAGVDRFFAPELTRSDGEVYQVPMPGQRR